MKKSILSLSAAVALGGLGFAGAANAIAVFDTDGAAGGPVVLHPAGTGHQLFTPYYTAQGNMATLINLVNTDAVNGKAVKVRFRGASNSDDVLDFTLFLSPGDVWAAEVSQNPSTGLARLSTPDNSCTLPTQVNRDFITARVNPKANLANETREGYIEILNMADVVPGTAVYTAIKHVKGAPPAACSNGAATPAALKPLLTEAGISAAGFSLPTTGLFANWSIVNGADATSWSGEATAIVAVDGSGLAGEANQVMWPQANGTPSVSIATVTADPLLVNGKVTPQFFDLPDLSTPYTGTGTTTAAAQAALLSGALAKTSIKNEYFTDDSVQAQTDWVFSLPTRRYSVALDYSASPVERVYTTLAPEYFNASNTTIEGTAATKKICVTDIDRAFWDRSEQKKESDDDFVISPSPIAPKINLCGEVAVWSINAGDEYAASALGASVARKNLEVGYADGWGKFVTPGLGNGLPMLGAAFAKATSTNIGAGVSGNFGLAWQHRYESPAPASGSGGGNGGNGNGNGNGNN